MSHNLKTNQSSKIGSNIKYIISLYWMQKIFFTRIPIKLDQTHQISVMKFDLTRLIRLVQSGFDGLIGSISLLDHLCMGFGIT